MHDNLSFGSWLTTTMQAQGLTVPSLAAAVSRGLVAVFNWRNGTHLPPSTVQAELAAALGVDVSEIRLRIARDRRAAHASKPSASVSA